MEETKMYCDICEKRIIDHDYDCSISIGRYLHGDIIRNIKVNICLVCRDKIKDLNKLIANENFESNFALCFLKIIYRLI